MENAEIILLIGTVVLAVSGLLVAGVAIWRLPRELMKDESALTAIEKLGDSVPRETAESMLQALQGISDAIVLLREALDGVPHDEKPKSENPANPTPPQTPTA